MSTLSSRIHWPTTTKRALALLTLALVVHLFVLPQLAGARKALDVIGSVNPWLLGLAVVLYAAALLVYALLTEELLPERDRPRFSILFGTVLASTGINHVVPGGAATTAAVNARLLGGAGVPRKELGFALGMQAIGSALVLNVLLWLALVVSIPVSGFHPIYATTAAIGAVLMGLFGGAVLAIRRGQERFASSVARLLGRLPRVQPERVEEATHALADQLNALLDDGGRLRIVIVLAAANWLFDAAALYVSLTAFGPRPSVVGVLVAYGLANVMASVPITPGGLGVVEAILIPSIVGFGTAAAQASVGVVAYRLVSFWLPIPVGAIAYLYVSRVTGRPGRFATEVTRHIDHSAESSSVRR